MLEPRNRDCSTSRPTLVIFGGLPGTGKTTIARELARQLGAVFLRIDSIEQQLRNSELGPRPIDDAGYCVAYALAEDNLRIGQTVIADSVNPIQLTRDAWLSVAHRAQTNAIEVEIVCSNEPQHRLRIETRVADVDGLQLLTWQEVVARQYDRWTRPHILIDTAKQSVSEAVRVIREALTSQ